MSPKNIPAKPFRVLLPIGWLLVVVFYGLQQVQSSTPEPKQNESPTKAIAVENVRVIRPNSNAPFRTPVANVMSEDFENTWPATGWDVFDASSADGGEHYMGQRDCHPHWGSYAGWSVGGGAQGATLPCSGEYPNNANAWAIYGPFDLSDASSATLHFHLYGITEVGPGCPDDFLLAGSSLNGSSFSGTIYCGDWTDGIDSNGYHHRELELASRLGNDEVWVGFALISDDSITFSGMTVDDITLEVEFSSPPTDTPTPTPTNTQTITPPPTNTPTSTPTSMPTTTPVPDDSTDNYLPVIVKPMPTPTPTSIPIHEWFGTNNHEREVYFTTNQNRTAVLLFEISFSAICNGQVRWFEWDFEGPYPVESDEFYILNSTNRVLRGSFTGATTAIGSWDWEFYDSWGRECYTVGTWDATKAR